MFKIFYTLLTFSWVFTMMDNDTPLSIQNTPIKITISLKPEIPPVNRMGYLVPLLLGNIRNTPLSDKEKKDFFNYSDRDIGRFGLTTMFGRLLENRQSFPWDSRNFPLLLMVSLWTHNEHEFKKAGEDPEFLTTIFHRFIRGFKPNFYTFENDIYRLTLDHFEETHYIRNYIAPVYVGFKANFSLMLKQDRKSMIFSCERNILRPSGTTIIDIFDILSTKIKCKCIKKMCLDINLCPLQKRPQSLLMYELMA